MRTATTISAIGHAVVLLWGVWSLAARPLANPPSDALPVDIVSADELSQITQGVKEAPKAEKQKPLVEKIAEAKSVEDPTAKVVEKKEVNAAREPPPAPEAKPVETKPEEKKSENKPQEASPEKKTAEAKPDSIAEALEKADSKPEPKKPAEKAHADRRHRRPRSLHHRPQNLMRSGSRRCSTSATRHGLQRRARPSTTHLRSGCPAARTRSFPRMNSMHCARGLRNCGRRPPARATRRNWSW